MKSTRSSLAAEGCERKASSAITNATNEHASHPHHGKCDERICIGHAGILAPCSLDQTGVRHRILKERGVELEVQRFLDGRRPTASKNLAEAKGEEFHYECGLLSGGNVPR